VNKCGKIIRSSNSAEADTGQLTLGTSSNTYTLESTAEEYSYKQSLLPHKHLAGSPNSW
jgi:hypothetical protein